MQKKVPWYRQNFQKYWRYWNKKVLRYNCTRYCILPTSEHESSFITGRPRDRECSEVCRDLCNV